MSRRIGWVCAALITGLLVAPVLAADVVMQDVESTLVQQIGYDPDTQTLIVKLVTDGSVYEYYGVPQEVYDQFMAAESKGHFFTKYIKNSYKYEKKQE